MTLKDKTINAVKNCEAYLKADKQHNLDNKILPSDCAIIDRMLQNRPILIGLYQEIHADLEYDQWRRVLAAIIYTTAGWNPNHAKQAREAAKRLKELNSEIRTHSDMLSKKMQERTELSEHSGYAANYEYDIVQLIHDSAEHNGHYQSFMKSKLERLRAEYGLKYWPKVHQVVDAIGAAGAEVSATDELTAAGTRSSRSSKADFFHSLFAAFKSESEGLNGKLKLPGDFRLSDASLAGTANVVLNIAAEDMIDSDYVKRLRQRQRENSL